MTKSHRRFIVVVKDDLAVAGIGLNITHWKSPLIKLVAQA